MVLPSKFGVRIIQMCVLYSNFYGRSAKEKTTELKAVDELLDEKLLQLKNY